MNLIFFVNLSYLIGALAFIWGLHLLSSPDTARKGNIWAAFGMCIAIIAAMLEPIEVGTSNNYGWIIAGMVLGGSAGFISAKRVQMTAMPQMVSIFNGWGGACAVVLAMVEFLHFYDGTRALDTGGLVIVVLALLIGGVAFTGSVLAYGKLEGIVNDRKVTLPNHGVINLVLLVLSLGVAVWVVVGGQEVGLGIALLLMALSLIYGFSFVAPIGGADMPVVISLLNSFTGLSAAAAGLIYGNNFMLVGGILVGASGTILTLLMCRAMNRSLLNVLVGGFGGSSASAAAGAAGDQVVKEVSLNDAAIQLYYSQSVMVVPGYGLAVAQAQKITKEMEDLLEANNVEVKYAIHPVAGRMPGHMNVLLAEADVPYPKLLDLEDANAALPNTDVVVVVGANDVVNPAAKDDPSSPIYGMPVLNVWDAKHVIVLKRGMSAGYAGIENPLFFHPKTRMLFGDAKKTISNLVSELKTL